MHAHSDVLSGVKSNCFMRVLRGGLHETLYAPSAVRGETVCADGATVRALDAGERHATAARRARARMATHASQTRMLTHAEDSPGFLACAHA